MPVHNVVASSLHRGVVTHKKSHVVIEIHRIRLLHAGRTCNFNLQSDVGQSDVASFLPVDLLGLYLDWCYVKCPHDDYALLYTDTNILVLNYRFLLPFCKDYIELIKARQFPTASNQAV